jgi:hypothetical protein
MMFSKSFTFLELFLIILCVDATRDNHYFAPTKSNNYLKSCKGNRCTHSRKFCAEIDGFYYSLSTTRRLHDIVIPLSFDFFFKNINLIV